MASSRLRSPAWLVPVIVGTMAGVFLIDAWTPVGVAVSMLYVIPVYLSGWLPQQRALTFAGLAATLLVFVGAVLSPGDGGLPWVTWMNRFLAVSAIWLSVAVGLVQRRLTAELKTLQGLIPICASCKKIRDEQGQWQALELYIRDHSDAEFTHGLCPICFEMYKGQIAKRQQA